MKRQLNEVKRMQQLAGLLNEYQLNEIDDKALMQGIKNLTDDDLKPISLNVRFNFEDVEEEKLLDGIVRVIQKVNPDADIEKKKMSLTRDLAGTNEKLNSATQKSFSAFQGLKDYFEDNLEIFK